jgi:tRNA threonylcarbamoyladenosine biosynthesis protein TsaE
LLKFAGNEKIFLFSGEMGAGKTTLIKSLCLELGMVDNVSSPTYSIVNEYVFPKGKIYHFDFFRIKNEVEAFDIGFEEYLMSGEYCFIEWPEMIPGLWPEHFIELKIVEDEQGSRKISAKII